MWITQKLRSLPRGALGILATVILIFAIAAPAAGAATIKAPTGTGLVGYWKFDEGTGTKANDSSGLGNAGTLSGTTLPTWTTGRLGKALSFDGSTSFVSLPGRSSYGFGTGDFAVSYNIKYAAFGGTGYQVPIDTGYANTKGFLIESDEHVGGLGTILRLYIARTIIATWTWPHVINTNYHVVITRSGSTITLYVNGVTVGSPATSAASIDADTNAGFIGKYSGGELVNGVLDDIRFYNRALSASEISALYKASAAVIKTPTKTGLVGVWTFDEGTSTLAHDASGNGNTGTIYGTPVWMTGKLGKALNFNGTSNYMDTPTSSSFSFGTGDFTYSVWIKPNSFAGYNHMFAYDGSQSNGALKVNVTDGAIYFYTPSFTTYGTINQNLQLGVWNHVVFMRRAGVAELYWNGVLKGTQSGFSNNFSGTHFMRFGNGWGSEFTNGLMDDMRFYSRALSATEVSALYKSTAAIANAPTNTSLTSGLVGLWSFDGKDMNWGTGTAYDRSGQGNNGTLVSLTSAASAVIGKIGQALKFNGNGQYITTAPISLPKFTVAAWVNPSGNQTGASAVVSDQYPSFVNYVIGFDAGTTNVYGGIYNGGWYQTPRVTLPSGKWTHTAITFDNNVLTLYINGASTTSAYAPITPQSSGTGINIGKRWDLPDYFSGLIDDVRIYSRALLATEIKSLYNLGR